MRLSFSQKQSLEEATRRYQGSIHLAEEYLEGRGISLQVANTFRLGVVEHPQSSHEQFVGRLAIPYITRTGVVDIRFRSIGPQEPKYLGIPGARTHLYNVLSTVTAGDFIAVCEGEIDTITLTACGIPAVGVPGVNNWKKHYSRILQDFETVYVFADGDQPGQDFAKHLAREVSATKIIQMPDGEDVNSMFCKYGADVLRSKL